MPTKAFPKVYKFTVNSIGKLIYYDFYPLPMFMPISAALAWECSVRFKHDKVYLSERKSFQLRCRKNHQFLRNDAISVNFIIQALITSKTWSFNLRTKNDTNDLLPTKNHMCCLVNWNAWLKKWAKISELIRFCVCFDIWSVHVIWTVHWMTNLALNVCFDFFSRHGNQIWK